jgi:hypothetical protein
MDGTGEHHQMKLARLRKSKDAHFLSCVEYRPNTNTAMLWKTGHAKGKSHMKGGRVKKEANKVNMVNVLSI